MVETESRPQMIDPGIWRLVLLQRNLGQRMPFEGFDMASALYLDTVYNNYWILESYSNGHRDLSSSPNDVFHPLPTVPSVSNDNTKPNTPSD